MLEDLLQQLQGHQHRQLCIHSMFLLAQVSSIHQDQPWKFEIQFLENIKESVMTPGSPRTSPIQGFDHDQKETL